MEELMVIKNYGMEGQAVKYCGNDELEAYKKLREIKGKKNLFKAIIQREMLHNVPIIVDFKIIEVIR